MRRALVGLALCAAAAHGAEFAPAGEAGQTRLLGPGAPSAAAVAAAVEADGFYAGPPIGAGACARCHPDVAASWSASAHRFSSFDNPYYTAAARAFHRVRGPDGFRFCAACHDPALDVAGPIDTLDETLSAPAAQAGIGCLVCHSIGEAPPPTGNGEYRAALAPVPIGDGHGARVRPAGIGDGRLCGTCHRVGLDAEVSGDRWRRGQDDQFGWADGPYAGGSVILAAPERSTCVDCHMPRVAASADEKGARDGAIRSHRVLGAGPALARIRGDAAHEAATAAFLRGVVEIDLMPGPAGAIDVVLTNVGAGHPLPGGVNDSNQVWLELVAADADGRPLYTSGVLDGGRVPEDAHLIRAQPVDPAGDPLAERAVHDLRSVVFDTRLPPLEPRAVRFLLPPGARRVTARVRLRQFDADYTRFACAPLPEGPARARCFENPVVDVARAEGTTGRLGADDEAALRHGLALAEGLAADARRAEQALRALAARRPDDPRPLLGAARAAAALGRTDAAVALIDRALALPDCPPVAHRLRAEALIAAYRVGPARAAAEPLTAAQPAARGTWALVARLRNLDGDPAGALVAVERLLALDPQHPTGHYQRMLALRALRRPEAADARLLYLRYRPPDEAVLRLRKVFRARHPRRAAHLEPIPTRGG